MNSKNDRLRIVRKSLGMTQTEFGEKIGIGTSGISKIEVGLNSLTDSLCFLICRTFNVRREWLETGEGEMFEPAAVTSDYIDRIVKEYNQGGVFRDFLETYMYLSPEHRALMDKFVEMAFDRYQNRQNAKSQSVPQSGYKHDIMSEDNDELTAALLERLEEQQKAQRDAGQSDG